MNKKFSGKFSAKGYYIALILCAAAIGISGYLYYRNLNQNEPQLQEPTLDADVLGPTEDGNVAVVGPGDDDNADDVVVTDPVTDWSAWVCAPVQGEIIAPYAMECLAYNPTTRDWRTHNGIDIAAEAGTAVRAAADGTVYTVYTDDAYGTTVVIRHLAGYVTEYSSLSSDVPVSAGDIVKMGDTIGYVGNTALLENAIGDHLHFAVTCNGKPLDPSNFFDPE